MNCCEEYSGNNYCPKCGKNLNNIENKIKELIKIDFAYSIFNLSNILNCDLYIPAINVKEMVKKHIFSHYCENKCDNKLYFNGYGNRKIYELLDTLDDKYVCLINQIDFDITDDLNIILKLKNFDIISLKEYCNINNLKYQPEMFDKYYFRNDNCKRKIYYIFNFNEKYDNFYVKDTDNINGFKFSDSFKFNIPDDFADSSIISKIKDLMLNVREIDEKEKNDFLNEIGIKYKK